MAIDTIGLSKLLEASHAKEARRRKLLRDDIRRDAKKASRAPAGDSDEKGKGGSFYVPFWADAKAHAAGSSDLRKQSKLRISDNPRRQRLYTLLASGFLLWWEEKRRFRNEPIKILPDVRRAPVQLSDLGAVKVGNVLAVNVEGHGPRVVFPYFCLEPELPESGIRMALWTMQRAINSYPPDAMRVLDIHRSQSFSISDTPLQGNEEELVRNAYEQLLAQRAALLAADDEDGEL